MLAVCCSVTIKMVVYEDTSNVVKNLAEVAQKKEQ